MTIVILGAGGMLGRAVQQVCEQENRDHLPLTHQNFDVTDPSSFTFAGNGDVVINCAGILPGGDDTDMIRVNSLAPHYLAHLTKRLGFQLIHVSTDCVFSGWTPDAPVRHSLEDTPNPDSLYGKAKYAGEPMTWGNVSVVRTSFVGPDHGLWKWLADQPQEAIIEGYTEFWWSGSTVQAVAQKLVEFSTNRMQYAIEHAATVDPISKYQVLQLLRQRIGRTDLTIMKSAVRLDRSLAPSLILPTLEVALGELRES